MSLVSAMLVLVNGEPKCLVPYRNGADFDLAETAAAVYAEGEIADTGKAVTVSYRDGTTSGGIWVAAGVKRLPSVDGPFGDCDLHAPQHVVDRIVASGVDKSLPDPTQLGRLLANRAAMFAMFDPPKIPVSDLGKTMADALGLPVEKK